MSWRNKYLTQEELEKLVNESDSDDHDYSQIDFDPESGSDSDLNDGDEETDIIDVGMTSENISEVNINSDSHESMGENDDTDPCPCSSSRKDRPGKYRKEMPIFRLSQFMLWGKYHPWKIIVNSVFRKNKEKEVQAKQPRANKMASK